MEGQEVLATSVAFERRTTYELAKRLVDVVLATLGLLAVGWLLLLAAAAVVATSRGPAFYPHVRVGLNGRSFRCWKLRTMVAGAEGMLERDSNLRDRYREEFKIRADPRVTPVGRILRATSIDELPQLWNVLRGDMSVVGPRPVLQQELIEKYGDHAETLLSVRPGITGLWQISGRSSLSYARRIELDLNYAARRSLRLDLAIIAKTPAALLRGEQID